MVPLGSRVEYDTERKLPVQVIPQPCKVLAVIAPWRRGCLYLDSDDPLCTDFGHDIDLLAPTFGPQVVKSRERHQREFRAQLGHHKGFQ